tara:strand:- start:416 stop:1009 length:594 start_codon:yes stop_codon:yes gene_type:complete
MIVQTSEKVDKILPALIDVKKSMSRFSKSWSASVLIKDKSTGTDRFSFDHTTLPVLNSIVEPFLRFNNLLCINLPTVEEDGKVIYCTRIYHSESSQFIQATSRMFLKEATSQQYGSAATYMQRYLKMALLDLASVGDDDDGSAATRVEQLAEQQRAIFKYLEEKKTNGEDGESDTGETEQDVDPENEETTENENQNE